MARRKQIVEETPDEEKPVVVDLGKYYDDPFEFFLAVMNFTELDLKSRMDAAKALAQIRKEPPKKIVEYKGRDAVRLESVESGNPFERTMPAPKKPAARKRSTRAK